MAGMGSTKTARAREMRRVLERWTRSGLSQRQFGEREGIPASTLAWWGHVFRHAEPVPKRRRTPRRRRPARRRTFVELKLSAERQLSPAAPLEVVLRSGHTIRVPAEFSTTMLRAIVAALESPC